MVIICYFTRPAILHACFQYSKVCGSIRDLDLASGQTSGVVNLDSNHVDSIYYSEIWEWNTCNDTFGPLLVSKGDGVPILQRHVM